MNAERIGELRRRAEAGLKNCSFDDSRQFYADLLALLGEAQIKAGSLRPEVASFAALMEAELRKHDDRPGWKNEDVQWLFSRLKDESTELIKAIHTKGPISIGREAADVANFAMMIADVYGGLKASGDQPAPPKNVTMGLIHDRLREVGIEMEQPAPPAGTTDGTLTFKMPQATTAPPAIKDYLTTEERREMADAFNSHWCLRCPEGFDLDHCPDGCGYRGRDIRALILSPPTAAVTRANIAAILAEAGGNIGITTDRVERAIAQFRDLGITVEEEK